MYWGILLNKPCNLLWRQVSFLPLPFVGKNMFDTVLHILTDYMEIVAKSFTPYVPGSTNRYGYSDKGGKRGKCWPWLKQVVGFLSPWGSLNGHMWLGLRKYQISVSCFGVCILLEDRKAIGQGVGWMLRTRGVTGILSCSQDSVHRVRFQQLGSWTQEPVPSKSHLPDGEK